MSITVHATRTPTRRSGACRAPLVALALVGLLTGCAESPATVTLPPAAGGGAPASGIVSLGRPLVGAEVTFYRYTGLVRGVALGHTTTDAAGRFSLSPAPATPGRILVVVTGGHYSEMSGGFDREVGASELSLVFDYAAEEAPDGLVVSGLSTLVRALAVAYLDQHVTPEVALRLAEERLSAHLVGPAGFDVGTTQPVDPTQVGFPWPDVRVAAGLFHAGLSEIARERGQHLGAPIQTTQLLDALVLDLSDGRFDGQGSEPGAVFVHGDEAVDVETTRWELAAAIVRYLRRQADDIAARRTGVALSYETLSADEELLTWISTDTGPLYPPGVKARRYDEDPPTLTFEVPTPADGAAVKGTLPVRLVAEDVSPLTVTLVADGDPVDLVEADPGVWTANVFIDGLGDGPLTLDARALDASENEATATRTVFLDSTPPVLTVEKHQASAFGIRLTGDAVDPGGLAWVEATWGDEVDRQVFDGATSSTFSLTIPAVDGDHALSVRAADRAGNQATALAVVTVDSIPPVVQPLEPLDGGWVAPGQQTALVTITDEHFASAELLVASVGDDGEGDGEGDGEKVGSAVSGSAPGSAVWMAPDAGEVTLTWRAMDDAGNVQSADVQVTVDGALPDAPLVTIIPSATTGSGADSAVWVRPDPALVSVTATDADSGIAAVSVGGAPAVFDDGVWTRNLTPTDGPLAVVATDNVGHQRTTTVQVALDDDAPTCAMLPVGNDGYINSLTPTVTGTWSDDGAAGVTILVSLPSGATVSADVAPDGTWSATLPAQSEGTVVLSLECSDALGNTRTVQTDEIIIDVTPPEFVLRTATSADDTYSKVHFVDGAALVQPGSETPFSAKTDCDSTGQDMWICGKKITRFFHRLGPASPDDPPRFSFDPAVLQSYRFMVGTTATSEWLDVEVFGDAAIVYIPTPEVGETQPDTVQIRLADEAGNERTATISYELNVVMPPLFPGVVSMSVSSDDGPEFMSADVYGSPAPSGPRILRYEVVNPYPFASAFRIDALPGVRGTRHIDRVYLPIGETFNGCPVGQCNYLWFSDTCASATVPPFAFTFDHRWFETTAVVFDIDGLPVPETNGWTVIPAESKLLVEVRAETAGTCFIGPGAVYPYLAPDGGVAYRELNSAPESCEALENPPDGPNDLTVCRFGANGLTFDVPRAVVSATLRGSANGPQYSVDLEYAPAGFYDWSTEDTLEASVDFSYSIGDYPSAPAAP